MQKNNLVLIGMPGAGKSTLGVLLAKELAKDFVDTDVLIQLCEGKTLQDIIDQSDYLALRQIEQSVLLQSQFANSVVATGGSVVYSSDGMAHLQGDGVVVFLDTDLNELRSRIHNFESRGVARRPGQSLEELFSERQVLYQRYADITVDCNGKTQERIVAEIISRL